MTALRPHPRIAAIAAASRLAVLGAAASRLAVLGLGAGSLLAGAPVAWAGPAGEAVKAGSAFVARSGDVTSIVQTSPRAVIDWRSFDIGAREDVRFLQPGTSAAILNRVLGDTPSTILGRLTANGQVFLVNGNGVLFGAGARVNVGGLLATTANLSTDNFMAGIYRFDQPGRATASVVNEGSIRVAEGGIAALVGRQVANRGSIVATLGKVALTGGDAFVLDLSGSRLVNLILDPTQLEQVTDTQGRPLIARVDQQGSVLAARVELSADTVSRLLDHVINVQGDVRATAATARGGVISLTGGSSTDLAVGGVLQASGPGGRIEIAGRDVTLAPTAQIDLSGGVALAVTATRDVAVQTGLNTLAAPAAAGHALEITAGRDLSITRSLALNNSPLSLSANAGSISTAPDVVLQAGDQALTLRGHTGVSLGGALLSAGPVSLSSAAGGVSVAGVVAAPGTGDAQPAARLQVQARDAVELAGVRAAQVEVRSTQGEVTARGGIDAEGPVTLEAGGALSIGTAGLRARSPGAAVTLLAGGDVRLDGDVITEGATLTVSSARGAVTARVAAPGGDAAETDAALSAGADPLNSIVRVTAAGTLTLGAVVAARGIELRSAEGDVALQSRLGGATTGYDSYALGYQGGLRPNVGTLSIDAPRGSVELNGLNLDGHADPRATTPALGVRAGRRILSNDMIAVNKGDIELRAGNEAGDGIFLGHSIFSRGWDFTGTDRARGGSGDAADTRLGYSISLSGHALGLFDNNPDLAQLPGFFRVQLSDPAAAPVITDSIGRVLGAEGRLDTANPRTTAVREVNGVKQVVLVATGSPEAAPQNAVLGEAVLMNVARVEISNNTANYTEAGQASRLVPTTTGSPATMSAQFTAIGGIAGAPGRRSLASLTPTLIPLSDTPNNATAAQPAEVSYGRGVGLKLLGFERADDVSTEVWSDAVWFGINSPLTTETNLDSFAYVPLKNGQFEFRFATGAGSPLVLESDDQTGLPCPSKEACAFRLQRQPDGRARIIDLLIDGTPQAQQPDAARRGPWLLPSTDGPFGVGATNPSLGDAMRFVGPVDYSQKGTADGIGISGNLVSADPAQRGPVTVAGTANPSALSPSTVPLNRQAADGTVAVPNAGVAAPGRNFEIGRTLVSTSLSSLFVPPSDMALDAVRGTRVFVFDGTVDSLISSGRSDLGGGQIVPAGAGVPGNNNSSTGFSAVRPGVSGVRTTVSVAPDATRVPPPPADPGFVYVPSLGFDAGVDVARVQPVAGSPPPPASPHPALAAATLELGNRPAAQADLGRSGGTSGAATNVFGREYKLVGAGDSGVCGSADIAAADPRRTPPPAQPGTGPGPAGAAAARPCPPTGR